MGYFKKHWGVDLQADVLGCAEEVVRNADDRLSFAMLTIDLPSLRNIS